MLGTAFDDTVAQAVAGSQDAFAALYRDANPSLLRYLTVMAPDLAEDAAAETWVSVIAHLDGFSGTEASFRSWLFTIARNKVIDAQRRLARRPTTPLSDDHDRTGPTAQDASDEVLEVLSTERALSLIGALPKDQAEAVMLRVVAGLDVAAVAEVMGRSPGAVRVLSHRGLKRLATALAEGREPPDDDIDAAEREV